jgi:predicted S18 family serine protease
MIRSAPSRTLARLSSSAPVTPATRTRMTLIGALRVAGETLLKVEGLVKLRSDRIVVNIVGGC